MTSFKFSANTGYLWKNLPFTDRIRMAKRYGFASLEFHDEARSEDRNNLKQLLSKIDLPINSINVRMGETSGCAAIPQHADQARKDIDEAADIAEDIGAGALHVLAGITADPNALETFLDTLRYALKRFPLTILIEPVCHEQLPGYFLRRIDQAADVLQKINHPRLKIMFDCYHVFRETGDLVDSFAAHADKIGHVQIAAAEGRAEPFLGTLDYAALLPKFKKLGYAGAFGCEYRPTGKTEDSLSWRNDILSKAV